jgi:uncharacterized membrane protein YfcA
MPPGSVLAALFGVVATAFAVESTLGFGAMVVTVTLGSLVLPIESLLPAFVPLNIAISLYLTVRYRASVDWPLLLRGVLPWMVAGLPLGLLVVRALGSGRLKTALGVLVVALAALELNRVRRNRARPGDAPPPAPAREYPAVRAGLLFLAGAVHGAFATGGPLTVYVTGRALADKSRFRATLSALWLVLNTALVAGYAVVGTLNAASARLSGALAAAPLVGLAAGEWLHRRVPVVAFRVLVFGVLLAVGVVLALGPR